MTRNVSEETGPTSGGPDTGAEGSVATAPTLPARIIAILLSGARAVSAPLRLPRQRDAADSAGMRRYKFQAVVAVIPGQDRTADALPGPDWHGILRAGSSLGRSHGMFSALVTDWDQGGTGSAGRAGAPHAVATIVAFGPDPAESLPVGGTFALWRGRDVGLGIVTQRAFVLP
jgi:hypothetical protein